MVIYCIICCFLVAILLPVLIGLILFLCDYKKLKLAYDELEKDLQEISLNESNLLSEVAYYKEKLSEFKRDFSSYRLGVRIYLSKLKDENNKRKVKK